MKNGRVSSSIIVRSQDLTKIPFPKDEDNEDSPTPSPKVAMYLLLVNRPRNQGRQSRPKRGKGGRRESLLTKSNLHRSLRSLRFRVLFSCTKGNVDTVVMDETTDVEEAPPPKELMISVSTTSSSETKTEQDIVSFLLEKKCNPYLVQILKELDLTGLKIM